MGFAQPNYTDPRTSRCTVFRQIRGHIQRQLDDGGVLEILMIDDSPRDIRMVEDILHEECTIPFKFVSIRNPIHAVRDLSTEQIKPTVIILDLVMPGMNGLMALRDLRNLFHTRHIPIVIHSSQNNYDMFRLAKTLDAHAFFSKPLCGTLLQKYLLNKL